MPKKGPGAAGPHGRSGERPLGLAAGWINTGACTVRCMHSGMTEELPQLPDVVCGGNYDHGTARRRVIVVMTTLVALVVASSASAAIL